MELRDIEIFLTVAEELHFGRAAERLHVSAARISQAVKRQERVIGGELFARNSHSVRLTRLGEQLRDELRPLAQGLAQTLERARLAARGKSGTLRVSLFPLNVHEMRRYWDTFRDRHPQWELRLRMAAFEDPFAQLRNGDVDVLITWLPVEEPDLIVGPQVFAEPRVLAVASDHALTRWSSVSLEALGDFRHVTIKTAPDYWIDHYVPECTPRGRPIERTVGFSSLEDIFLRTVMGEAVGLFPSHTSRYFARPGLAFLPVRDMDALPYGLVWLAAAENDMVRALARVVSELGPLPG